MLRRKVVEKTLGDRLNIQCLSQAARRFGDAEAAMLVQLANVHKHGADLAQEQVARLTPDIQMLARSPLAALALDPIPQALSTLAIQENEQVFIADLRHLTMDGGAGLAVGDLTLGRCHLKHGHAAQFGDRPALKPRAIGIKCHRPSLNRA